MINVTAKDEQEIVWFPCLMKHKNTRCVAIFTSINHYIVIDEGEQIHKIGSTSDDPDMSQWKIFAGTLFLKNSKGIK